MDNIVAALAAFGLVVGGYMLTTNSTPPPAVMGIGLIAASLLSAVIALSATIRRQRGLPAPVNGALSLTMLVGDAMVVALGVALWGIVTGELPPVRVVAGLVVLAIVVGAAFVLRPMTPAQRKEEKP